MERPREVPPILVAGEHALPSLRVVMARMTDTLWEADARGSISAITLCRPSQPQGDGALDEMEVQQIEQLWRKSVKCAERLSAVYHIRSPAGLAPRTFVVQAIPVLNNRDEVRHWAGTATEVNPFNDAATRFISEAAAVLSSSLNRNTIVNRLVQSSIDYFCDYCAVYTFDENGAIRAQGVADRRANAEIPPEALERGVAEVLRTRQPLLLLSDALRGAPDERLQNLLDSTRMRSMIVVPLFVGSSCIGALCFLESERPASFAAHDLDVGVVVARQLAMALENIKTFEREQHVTERFRFLARTTESLFATLDSAKMLRLLLDAMVDSFSDYAIAAALKEGRLRIVAASGTGASALREESEREMVRFLGKRRSILVGSEVDARQALKPGPVYEAGPPVSWMMVPLFSGDSVYGAIVCCSNGRLFDGSDLELLEEIGRRAALALDHAETFERERRLTHTLQQATLPTQLASVENASISFVYRPAASDVQVGGDWYDAFELDDHRVLLTVGDVTGHGLQASMVMGKLRHAINVVAMYERNPVRILDAAERILLRRYPGSVATAFVALLDSRAGTITYANAGHPYPLLRRVNEPVKELEAEGLPIGLRSIGGPVSPVTESLESTGLLAFYTDGLTEATRDTFAGEKLLHQAVGTNAVFYVDSAAEFIEAYCLPNASQDDVAILVLNFVTSRRWKFDSRDCGAARLARCEFVAQIADRSAPDGDLKVVELIFGELTANVAQHAAGPLEIALDWHAGQPVLHVIDRGRGYTASHRRKADLLTEHGRGLWLVQRLGARLDVEVLPGFGTHVQATLPIRQKR